MSFVRWVEFLTFTVNLKQIIMHNDIGQLKALFEKYKTAAECKVDFVGCCGWSPVLLGRHGRNQRCSNCLSGKPFS